MLKCPSEIHGFIDIMKRKPEEGDFVWLLQVQNHSSRNESHCASKGLIQFKEI